MLSGKVSDVYRLESWDGFEETVETVNLCKRRGRDKYAAFRG